MPELLSRRRLDQPRQPRRISIELDPELFGRFSERIARFIGTGKFLFWQTMVVLVWVAVNISAISLAWDPYPFILLNLAFSTQAAYAAPLILLAQTRQADRDKVAAQVMEHHRDELATRSDEHQQAIAKSATELKELLEANTTLTRQDKELTEQVAKLTWEIHSRLGPAT